MQWGLHIKASPRKVYSKNKEELEILKGRGKKFFPYKPCVHAGNPSSALINGLEVEQENDNKHAVSVVEDCLSGKEAGKMSIAVVQIVSTVVPSVNTSMSIPIETHVDNGSVLECSFTLSKDNTSLLISEVPHIERALSFKMGLNDRECRKGGKSKKKVVLLKRDTRRIGKTNNSPIMERDKCEISGKRLARDEDVDMEDADVDTKKSKTVEGRFFDVPVQVAEVGHTQPREHQ